MDWPNDADGDVLRRMQESGFDFARAVDIDFDHWPLSDDEKKLVTDLYPDSDFIDPDAEDIDEGIDTGFVLFQIRGKVTYELVINTQKSVTRQMEKIGGLCESWGVMQE